MSKLDYKRAFVLYESVYAQFERLLKADKLEGANRYIDAVMQYGLYGVIPEENDEVWLYGLDNVIASINSAKSNYNKKIHIPREELEGYLQEGLTQAEIAEKFHCSVDTIQRRIKEYGLYCLPPKDYFCERDTAEGRIETGRSYPSSSLSSSSSDSYTQFLREKEEIDDFIRRASCAGN